MEGDLRDGEGLIVGTVRVRRPLVGQDGDTLIAARKETTMGEFTDKAKGIANEVAGNAKQQSADPATRAEGRAQERTGEAQNLKGKVKGALGDKI
jgi:uncharacterized protein YjbJ (UPF0337 family)